MLNNERRGNHSVGAYESKIGEDATDSSNSCLLFYHYTREESLEKIYADNGGLYAYRPVACPHLPKEYDDYFLIEGFLEPLPNWLVDCPYFKNAGMELMRKYIGDVLLKIEIPEDLIDIFIADYARILECKAANSPLGLGYHCINGLEATQAYVNSYIRVQDYKGGHISPVVQMVRQGKGMTIPKKYISISENQPLLGR